MILEEAFHKECKCPLVFAKAKTCIEGGTMEDLAKRQLKLELCTRYKADRSFLG